jgi:HEAT repeat protein
LQFSFLAKHANQDSIDFLIDQLSENDIVTQQNAAVALSKADKEPTAELVLEYLKSTDTTIINDTTDDSEYSEDEDFEDDEEMAELSDDIKTILLRAFGEWKYQPATDYLKQLLESEISGKFVKMYAMSSLAQIGDLSAVELMREKLGDPEVKVREFAAASLASFENATVLPIYMDMLRHNDAKIRVYACQGIAKNKDTTKVDLLLYKFQKDPDTSVKNEALWTLLSMGNTGITPLKETLDKKKLSPSTLGSIATGTVKTPSAENVAFLKELYENADKAGKKVVEKIVFRTDSHFLDPILELLLQSEDPQIRLAAAGTLKKIKDTTLINKLKDMKENDSDAAVKRTAAKTLEIIGIQ